MKQDIIKALGWKGECHCISALTNTDTDQLVHDIWDLINNFCDLITNCFSNSESYYTGTNYNNIKHRD